MLTVRLESTIDDCDRVLYNKLFIFDSSQGKINVYTTSPFELNGDCSFEQIQRIFDVKITEPYKFIINKKVKDSYSFPFKIYIDITDKCQLNCKHCLTKNLNLSNELEYEKIKDIIDECDKNGVFFVKLGGGEPLLHPNIFKIIEDLSEKNILVSLSTNGYLINDRTAKFLKKNNVKVSVSLEGPKEINDYIRGKGHYDNAIRALKILKENDCNVVLRVTLTRFMLDKNYIYQMIELAKENDVKLKISYCRPAGNAIDNELLINYEDRKKYFEAIELLNEKQYEDIILLDEGMQLKQDKSLESILYNDRICGAANRSFHINSAAKLSPCVFLGDNYLEKESNYEKGDIERYWSEEKGTKIRNIRNVSIPNKCSNCYRLCKYECMATRLYFNGTFEECDPNCLGGFEKCLKLR